MSLHGVDDLGVDFPKGLGVVGVVGAVSVKGDGLEKTGGAFGGDGDVGHRAPGESPGKREHQGPGVGAQDWDLIKLKMARNGLTVVKNNERLVSAGEDGGNYGDSRTQGQLDKAGSVAKVDPVAFFIRAKRFEVSTGKDENLPPSVKGLLGRVVGRSERAGANEEAI